MARRAFAPIFSTCAIILSLALAACGESDAPPGGTDITGAMPKLEFRMMRARDAKPVTADDFRGKIVLLYFGYTNCPDVCPLTLANLADVLDGLGNEANDVRVLFVSVDPHRDTLPVLKTYAAAFSPDVVGLRGTDNQIAALARRYRVAYNVSPATKDHPYIVNHSSAVFFFDRAGRARYVVLRTDDRDQLIKMIRHLVETTGD